MGDVISRFLENLHGRLTGPMTFRLILQPTMAIYYGVRDGLKDARAGKPFYFFEVFTDAPNRGQLLADGLKALARVIILGVVMDVIYQFMVFRWVYPGELVAVVILLVILPYVLVRGLTNRIARRVYARRSERPRA